jgi:hypothetical protein
VQNNAKKNLSSCIFKVNYWNNIIWWDILWEMSEKFQKLCVRIVRNFTWRLWEKSELLTFKLDHPCFYVRYIFIYRLCRKRTTFISSNIQWKKIFTPNFYVGFLVLNEIACSNLPEKIPLTLEIKSSRNSPFFNQKISFLNGWKLTFIAIHSNFLIKNL